MNVEFLKGLKKIDFIYGSNSDWYVHFSKLKNVYVHILETGSTPINRTYL